MLPVSELNRMRREAVRELEILWSRPTRWTLHADRERAASIQDSRSSRRKEALTCDDPHLQREIEPPYVGCYEKDGFSRPSGEAELIVLVRSLAQLEAVLNAQVKRVYCEFENPKKYRDAVDLARKAGLEIFVAPPRIFKMGEEWTLKQVHSCEADGYLVRNYDHLNFFANDRRVGDFSLNIANRLTAEYFKNKFGLERVTASYDLNFAQLESLIQAAPPEWFEVTVHQHIPMFHMEHCVFCAFLSSGTDYTNCGRPCDKHDLKLRDRVGAQHPVKADVGCRNTVFNALAQTGAEYIPRMLDLGVRSFRLEFLNETPQQVMETIAKYRQLLNGEITGQQLWRDLRLLNQLGVTRGQIGNR